jgi:hypothetical protein
VDSQGIQEHIVERKAVAVDFHSQSLVLTDFVVDNKAFVAVEDNIQVVDLVDRNRVENLVVVDNILAVVD